MSTKHVEDLSEHDLHEEECFTQLTNSEGKEKSDEKPESSSAVKSFESLIMNAPETVETEIKKFDEGNASNINIKKPVLQIQKKKKKGDKSVQPLVTINPFSVLDGVDEFIGENKKFAVNPLYRSSSEDSEETISLLNAAVGDDDRGESSRYVFKYEEPPRRSNLCERLFSFLRVNKKRKDD
ncbi:PREDICTED: uncharacterized protein LOC108561458 [Nicrophorus vespilloides]|uniref:Uncharacterized protein LOC108561458 n=1 Tax=Nicrophorus vespilloides TaxID=110193 RepID=A0ABM1MJY9_NICVS|nr:PREDICTED: uncharacterized protein LOC108561458 [Nicrophorus vespilloides]